MALWPTGEDEVSADDHEVTPPSPDLRKPPKDMETADSEQIPMDPGQKKYLWKPPFYEKHKGSNKLVFDDSGISNMHFAAQDRETTLHLKTLIDAGHDVNVRNKASGETPLWSAVTVYNLPAVKLLLASGADVNVTGKNGNSPLHTSSYRKISILLLDRGANPNQANSLGFTPLHSAAYFGRLDAARVLIENGADRSVRDGEGRTPLDIANEREKQELVQLLSGTDSP